MATAKPTTTRPKKKESMENTEPGTEVMTTIDSPYAIVQATVDGSDLATVVAENSGIGGMNEFDLDRVKVPSGGGTVWMVPTLDGEEAVRELVGIVVYFREARGYWAKGIEEGGSTPPDCASQDAMTGVGDPGGPCRPCPLSQWGSDPREGSNGQACKQRRLLFVVREGDFLPLVVSVPPTSLKGIGKYFMRLTSKSTPYYGVVTKLTLSKTKSDGGIEYSIIDAALERVLTPQETAAVKEYATGLKATFETFELTETDVA